MLKLKDVIPPSMWLTGDGGVMTAIMSRAVPWSNSQYPWINQGSDLDMLYHGGNSGQKYISPLVDIMRKQDNWLDTVCRAIWGRYIDKWTRIYNAMMSDYNPIDNYKLQETETNTGTRADTGTTIAATDYGKEVQTDTDITYGKDTHTSVSDTTDTVNYIYGFDQDTQANKDGNNVLADGTSDVSNSGMDISSDTVTNSGNDTTTNTLNTTNTIDLTKTVERSGNIGVTTSQQMIESEIALRMHDYFAIVFADIDSVLCLHIY